MGRRNTGVASARHQCSSYITVSVIIITIRIHVRASLRTKQATAWRSAPARAHTHTHSPGLGGIDWCTRGAGKGERRQRCCVTHAGQLQPNAATTTTSLTPLAPPCELC